MKALVLPGGGIKGPWQAGAIQEVIKRGYKPDVIYGVSVGALNGAFLTGRYADFGQIGWNQVASDLVDFWETNVKSFDDIGSKRKWYKILWDSIRNRFVSVMDLDKLDKLVKQEITAEDLFDAAKDEERPLHFYCGTVNLRSGEYREYSNTNPIDPIVDAALASTRIPLVMPIQWIEGEPYYDGGIRNVAPLGSAIKNGASEIVVIPCHPSNLSGVRINTGSVIQLIQRVLDIMLNEIMNNDLKQTENRNVAAQNGGADKYRYVPMTVIRPLHALDFSLDDFTATDISRMIELGIIRAQEVLGDKRWD